MPGTLFAFASFMPTKPHLQASCQYFSTEMRIPEGKNPKKPHTPTLPYPLIFRISKNLLTLELTFGSRTGVGVGMDPSIPGWP